MSYIINGKMKYNKIEMIRIFLPQKLNLSNNKDKE